MSEPACERDPRSRESKAGAGEPVVQPLGSPAALAESLDSVPSTHRAPSQSSVSPCHERGKTEQVCSSYLSSQHLEG